MRPAAARRRKQMSPGKIPGTARAPYPGFIDPCLATPGDAVPDRGEWIHEIKHDGYRALVIKDDDRIQIRSRKDKDLTSMYPSVVAAARKLTVGDVVLDGEIVALDAKGKPSFEALQNRASHPTHRIVFYAFDVLHFDGRDVTGESLERRRARLQEIIGQDSTLRISQALPGTAAAVVEVVRAAGLEGVMAKRKDSIYRPGERSDDWVKKKLDRQQVRGTCGCRVRRNDLIRIRSFCRLRRQTALRADKLKMRMSRVRPSSSFR